MQGKRHRKEIGAHRSGRIMTSPTYGGVDDVGYNTRRPQRVRVSDGCSVLHRKMGSLFEIG